MGRRLRGLSGLVLWLCRIGILLQPFVLTTPASAVLALVNATKVTAARNVRATHLVPGRRSTRKPVRVNLNRRTSPWILSSQPVPATK